MVLVLFSVPRSTNLSLINPYFHPAESVGVVAEQFQVRPDDKEYNQAHYGVCNRSSTQHLSFELSAYIFFFFSVLYWGLLREIAVSIKRSRFLSYGIKSQNKPGLFFVSEY